MDVCLCGVILWKVGPISFRRSDYVAHVFFALNYFIASSNFVRV